MIRTFVIAVMALLLAACGSSSPGPLAGTWQVAGIAMKTTFRAGESETMGLIEHVNYKVEGQSVIVTYTDGIMRGTAVRFVLVNPTTATALNMTYRKVGS